MNWRAPLIAVLIVVCGPVNSCADTVAEKLASDPDFKLYAVIFGVTLDSKTNIQSFRVSKVIEPKSGNITPVDIKIPAKFIEKSRTWWVADRTARKKLEPKLKDGKPVEFFTYVFYSPSAPDVVITEKDKPLDQQP